MFFIFHFSCTYCHLLFYFLKQNFNLWQLRNRWMQAVVSTSLQGFCSANSSHGLELKVIVVVVVLYVINCLVFCLADCI